jgi:hypothetical protein
MTFTIESIIGLQNFLFADFTDASAPASMLSQHCSSKVTQVCYQNQTRHRCRFSMGSDTIYYPGTH